jgi:hypothetical protein
MIPFYEPVADDEVNFCDIPLADTTEPSRTSTTQTTQAPLASDDSNVTRTSLGSSAGGSGVLLGDGSTEEEDCVHLPVRPMFRKAISAPYLFSSHPLVEAQGKASFLTPSVLGVGEH